MKRKAKRERVKEKNCAAAVVVVVVLAVVGARLLCERERRIEHLFLSLVFESDS